MAQASGGTVKPYGNAISDALNDPQSTTEQLNGLRDSARSLLEAQGDLPDALAKLEAEIARRGGK